MVFGLTVKTRETKSEFLITLVSKRTELLIDDSTRGNYAPMVDAPTRSQIHSSIPWVLLHLGPIVALLLIGASLMLAHHFFYAYLNEKSIGSAAAELPSLLQNQNNINFIGTTIAHGARIVLSMAIGATFAQLFWETLRAQSHTVRQIDALANCGQSPFHPSSLRAATTSLALFILSFIASATALIVILTPGSLTVSSDFQRSWPCTVPSVPQNVTKSDYSPSNDAVQASDWSKSATASRILSSNSYVPPFQTNQVITCGNAISCSYNVSFVGLALDCVDITNQTDFTQFLNTHGTSPAAPFLIWNTNSLNDSTLAITISSRDLVNGMLQATNCTPYNATYNVGVSLKENSATVQVWNVIMGSVVNYGNWASQSFMSRFGSDAMSALSGTVFAGPNAYTVAGPDVFLNVVQNSPFFATTSTGNHTFTDTLMHFATSFTQNISISLLSGNINYDFSNDTETNLEDVDSTCSSSATVYIYDSSRLLSTYGVNPGAATAVVMYGCWLILRNGVEQKLLFSHVIQIALNEEMFASQRTYEDEHGYIWRAQVVRREDFVQYCPKMTVSTLLKSRSTMNKVSLYAVVFVIYSDNMITVFFQLHHQPF